jgi:hypothetical protein
MAGLREAIANHTLDAFVAGFYAQRQGDGAKPQGE